MIYNEIIKSELFGCTFCPGGKVELSILSLSSPLHFIIYIFFDIYILSLHPFTLLHKQSRLCQIFSIRNMSFINSYP